HYSTMTIGGCSPVYSEAMIPKTLVRAGPRMWPLTSNGVHYPEPQLRRILDYTQPVAQRHRLLWACSMTGTTSNAGRTLKPAVTDPPRAALDRPRSTVPDPRQR